MIGIVIKKKISKASNVRKPDAIFYRLAEGLSTIEILNYVKFITVELKPLMFSALMAKRNQSLLLEKKIL